MRMSQLIRSWRAGGMQWLDGWADTRAEFEKIRRNSIDTTTSGGPADAAAANVGNSDRLLPRQTF